MFRGGGITVQQNEFPPLKFWVTDLQSEKNTFYKPSKLVQRKQFK